ncbi:MAG: hypothetical protein HOJ15_03330 [Candidatus Jacksonbacteria bacterium]|nr:hypothetical protein [Candidatus Jacksonbacteria bacterium]MBT6756784.1 hypothetical protein [Candidatus Jacksonbacteria bacterium]MBT7338188.1 hypothetical protein [Candidatus Jacksonbacteria bacterium]
MTSTNASAAMDTTPQTVTASIDAMFLTAAQDAIPIEYMVIRTAVTDLAAGSEAHAIVHSLATLDTRTAMTFDEDVGLMVAAISTANIDATAFGTIEVEHATPAATTWAARAFHGVADTAAIVVTAIGEQRASDTFDKASAFGTVPVINEVWCADAGDFMAAVTMRAAGTTFDQASAFGDSVDPTMTGLDDAGGFTIADATADAEQFGHSAPVDQGAAA